MSALPSSEDPTVSGIGPRRWSSPSGSRPSTSPAGWLFGERGHQVDEVAELKRRLAEAERRAESAEEALPHLLALGQRTVNGLLSDARSRGRRIIEEARVEAERELEAERRAVQAEGAELEALRMAVAAEAMGLEQVRQELEAAIAALQLPEGSRPLAESGRSTRPGSPFVLDPAAILLPPPPAPGDAEGAAVVGSATPPAPAPAEDRLPGSSRRSTRFADAWAEGEDDLMSEAFDRFFAGGSGPDPQRAAILDDDSDDDR